MKKFVNRVIYVYNSESMWMIRGFSMIRLLFALCGLWILPVAAMLFLKASNRKVTLAAGYICGAIVNLTVFSLCIRSMSENMKEPGLLPLKAVLGVVFIEILVFLIVVCTRCVREKKWIGFARLFYMEQSGGFRFGRWETVFFIIACVIWILGATSYLRYVPEGAVTMMADINRLDFFGLTNADPMIMLGYYLKKLFGISQADAVCIVIPLSFYAAFVAVMWEIAGALFESEPLKKSLCFLAESVLVVVGDCLYTQPYMVLHGLNHMNNVLFVLCVPLVFAIGLRFYQSGENAEGKGPRMWGYWFAFAVCVLSTYLFEQRAFALIGLNAVIFVLLFVGRRYLPWLQSSKS